MREREPRGVLHVIGTLDPGGVERWLLSLFTQTHGPQTAHAVVTLGPAPGSLEKEASKLGVSVWRCPLRPSPSFPRRFSRLLRAVAPRVVHSHVHHASGFLLWLAHRNGVPVRVAHSHTTRDGRPPTPARRLYRQLSRHLIHRYTTAGVAASSECADALFGGGWAADPRFRVIHNGIDLGRFSADVDRDDVRPPLGFPPEALVVGQIGRFHAVKNHEFTLRVAEVLCRRDPRVRFLFAGEGPLRGAMEQRTKELRIEGRCAFVGEAGHRVPRLLRGGMDLVLCPSLWEGLPVSLVEAQAAGLPILASAAITREVAAVPGLVRFLELSAGPAEWAAAAEAMASPTSSGATNGAASTCGSWTGRLSRAGPTSIPPTPCRHGGSGARAISTSTARRTSSGQHDSGALYVWFMDGASLVSGAYLNPWSVANPDWEVARVADTDLDGYADILWRHRTTGTLHLWYMVGPDRTSETDLTPSQPPDTLWKVVPRSAASWSTAGQRKIARASSGTPGGGAGASRHAPPEIASGPGVGGLRPALRHGGSE